MRTNVCLRMPLEMQCTPKIWTSLKNRQKSKHLCTELSGKHRISRQLCREIFENQWIFVLNKSGIKGTNQGNHVLENQKITSNIYRGKSEKWGNRSKHALKHQRKKLENPNKVWKPKHFDFFEANPTASMYWKVWKTGGTRGNYGLTKLKN